MIVLRDFLDMITQGSKCSFSGAQFYFGTQLLGSRWLSVQQDSVQCLPLLKPQRFVDLTFAFS